MSKAAAPDPAGLPQKRNSFGLRTRDRFPASLFTGIAQRLRRLAEEDETPAAREFVESVLRCPYWGLRVLAIRAIGAWRGRPNKAWLLPLAARPVPRRRKNSGKAERWEALETETTRAAIAPLLTHQDATWLLEAYFTGWLTFGPLSLAVNTDKEIEAGITRELAGHDADRRTAALWLAWNRKSLPTRSEILQGLVRDADPAIAHQAARMLQWDEAGEGAL